MLHQQLRVLVVHSHFKEHLNVRYALLVINAHQRQQCLQYAQLQNSMLLKVRQLVRIVQLDRNVSIEL